tara:strand:+ start:201 stop:770 length:570 start_codon:yes stop_codon:yes gene_type:complete
MYMSSQNLIICEDKILYEIFLEIKEFVKFEVNFFTKKDIFKIKSENFDDYLILTYENITNINHILKIDRSPLKITNLIEKINISFLRKKFSEQSKFKINNYYVDLNSREIVFQNKKLKLTEKEITTILYLVSKKKEVTVSELQNKVWGYQKELETHTVETHIHRLRKKILQGFGDKKFISSNKNGYKIN